MKRWFHLGRPEAPSVRAQDIQQFASSGALARRGLPIVVPWRPLAAGAAAPADVGPAGWRLPTGRTLAAVVFRALAMRHALRGGGFWCRDWRLADELLRVAPRVPLVFEAHEVPADTEPNPGAELSRMRRVLAGALGVVTNAQGTADRLVHWVGSRLPAMQVSPNATSAARLRDPGLTGSGVGWVGNMRLEKDVDLLRRAAPHLPDGLILMGPGTEALSWPGVVGLGPIPHAKVPDVLAACAVLALPLADGPYGRELAAPLKLWDYLATGVPIVGADLPSLHRLAPGQFVAYRPGDVADFLRAVEEARSRPRLAPVAVRTWDDRADEIIRFLAEVAP